jgi:2,4-dienoyl-CoA reductase-like NADH-dependent reductase (Old Yellow Enzyme family)
MTQPMVHFRIARGGMALIINGGVTVHASGRMGPESAIFDDDERIPSFRWFAESVQEGGATVAFQTTHGGLWSAPYQLKTGAAPVAPSFWIEGMIGAYSAGRRHDCPATTEQIRDVIAAYGDAAARAKAAGFDAVEVHAAHESLLSQFLSPFTNRREDEWGGSVENRCRIHRDVLADVRTKVGAGFPVLMKLGVQDMLAGGLMLEDGCAAAATIAAAGNVDAIEISQGLCDNFVTDPTNTSMRMDIDDISREGYYRQWTKQVSGALEQADVRDSTAIICQGGLRSFELMEEIVTAGEADLVSLCRPYIREPKLVARWLSGDTSKATCVSCNECLRVSFTEHKPLKCRHKAHETAD